MSLCKHNREALSPCWLCQLNLEQENKELKELLVEACYIIDVVAVSDISSSGESARAFVEKPEIKKLLVNG